MANFPISYNLTKKHEGFYVNDPQDPGRETYMGISRRYHPKWGGWGLIDQYKVIRAAKLMGTIPKNMELNDTIIPGLHALHYSYSLVNFWPKIGGNGITNQAFANLIFDVYWGFPGVIKYMQGVLGVTADGIVGTNTLAAINNHPNLQSLYTAIYNWRIQQYAASPVYATYKNGWLARAAAYPKSIATDGGNAGAYAKAQNNSKTGSMLKKAGFLAAGLFLFTFKDNKK
jgi:lysozyme family protein